MCTEHGQDHHAEPDIFLLLITWRRLEAKCNTQTVETLAVVIAYRERRRPHLVRTPDKEKLIRIEF